MTHETSFLYRSLPFADDAVPAQAGYSRGSRSQWRYGTRNDEVVENYAAFSRAFGLEPGRVVMPLETHTANVATVSAVDGGGGVSRPLELLDVDGLVTGECDLALCITICDCAPVYLADADGHAVGLLHCGWRGTRGGIIAEGVRRMEALGARRADMYAIVGPHICADCFEVGGELIDEFARIHTPEELETMFRERDGRLTLDLTVSIRLQLLAEGIGSERIVASDECTMHGDTYFSYRRGERELRNLGFIVLRARH